MSGLSTVASALPWLALAFGASAWLAGLRPGSPVARRLPAALWTASAAFACAGLALLAYEFLAADLRVAYVFFYTRQDLAWQWRLAGTWAGREGSLMLWAAASAVCIACITARRRHMRADAEAAGTAGATASLEARTMQQILGLVVLALLAAVAAQDTFAATSSNLLAGRPTGNGLNPTLKSFYILIHPPIMFTAYALSAVPAAAGLAAMRARASRTSTASADARGVEAIASAPQQWSTLAQGWSRLDWLLYTAAIGLGSLWAYYTLGFGGYWAWDPVEVANLLPWLALTLYLHVQLEHRRSGRYAHAGPLLATLPFLFTLFSTISTRSGLWVSVHAFTDPTDTFDPDAAARFLSILDVEPSLRLYVGMFLVVASGGLALWTRSLSAATGRLPRASLGVAACLGAIAGLSAVEPHRAVAILLEAGHLLGSTGYGLLAVVAVAVLAAAAPLLAAGEEPIRFRLGLRTLAAYSIGVLGSGLLVMFLFHLAAVNGWSTTFYESRFPFLAAPLALGFVVLQLLAAGRRAAWLGAGAAAAAGSVAYLAWGPGALLATLAASAVAAGLWRVHRAGAVGSTRTRASTALLLVALLLDLLFWLNPPSRVGMGAWTWEPRWPVQAILGAAAAGLLVLALRLQVGAPWSRVPAGFVFAAAGLLAGFWVASLLAGAGWLLWRGSPLQPVRLRSPAGVQARARLRQVGIYGSHLALAIALLGYAPSTYGKERAEVTLGALASEAPHATLRLVDSASPGEVRAEVLRAVVEVAPQGGWHGTPVRVSVDLVWEAQAGAYLPHPATARTWDADLFMDIGKVQVEASPSGSPCVSAAQGIEAYRASATSPCAGSRISAVTLGVVRLPGLGLMWLAWSLLLVSMALAMSDAGGRRQTISPASARAPHA